MWWSWCWERGGLKNEVGVWCFGIILERHYSGFVMLNISSRTHEPAKHRTLRGECSVQRCNLQLYETGGLVQCTVRIMCEWGGHIVIWQLRIEVRHILGCIIVVRWRASLAWRGKGQPAISCSLNPEWTNWISSKMQDMRNILWDVDQLSCHKRYLDQRFHGKGDAGKRVCLLSVSLSI